MVNKENFKVIRLFYAKPDNKPRIKANVLEIDDLGVIGDKYYNKDKNRAILLTSIKSYNIVKENNIEIKFGDLGENIIVDFNISDLTVGNKFKIGNILFEVSMICPRCEHLVSIDKRVPKLLKNDRGIFIKALNKGQIKINDEIILKEI